MSIELAEARKVPLFNSSALTDLIWSPKSRSSIDKIIRVLEKEPLFNKNDKLFMNRRQLLKRALKGQVRLMQLQKKYGWDRDTLLMAVVLLDDLLPFTLHFSAFMAVIEAQGTEEQRREWISPSEKMEILGCYAQTELGHGSNVQGLETTATYIPDSDEFEINSPSLTSAKWWIGGLGVMSTHALVQATLYISGTSYGPHLFIVPVRSPHTMAPLANIQIGDIGSKAFGGFGSIDNGYVHFSKVRIPRKNMLQRYSQVTSTGDYIKPKQDKLSYGSMITLRVSVVANESWNLARALTIAVRYTNVRRQFSLNGDKEEQVITYSSVKHRLFPLLGVCFAYIFAAKGLGLAYMEMMSDLNTKGESKRLAEVHALSTGLKACATWDCLAGIEECRKACGGHGFSAYAGIGHIWANGVASQTYEGKVEVERILMVGDNYVICQQTAKACLKYMARRSNLPPSAEYLGGSDLTIREIASEHWRDGRIQLRILEERARRTIMKLGEQIQKGVPWKDLNMDCVAVSRAHVDVYLVRTFISSIARVKDSTLIAPLSKLLNLFALHVLNGAVAQLLTYEIITPSQAQMLSDVHQSQIIEMTPQEAVQITDAFEFTDYELGSVLGRYDGRVYETLWEEVKKDPVNSDRELGEEVLKMLQGNWGNSSKL